MAAIPPLASLRVFEAAGRLEHFSRAADELGLTQAAVSYQIGQLEAQLGQKLFDRERGRVQLNATGRRLHAPLAEAFATIRQAFDDFDEESSAVLSVSAPVSFGSTWLSAVIGGFQLRHPDLALRLSLSNDVVDLPRGEHDLAIRLGRGNWDGLRADFLYRLYCTAICSPEFAEEHEISEPADLLRVNRINSGDELWPHWFRSLGLESPPPVERGIRMENQSQEVSAAQAGFGVALVTPMFWRAELESGRLVQPVDHIYVSPYSAWLVHPERRVGVRKIERFREWICEELVKPETGIPDCAFEQVGGGEPSGTRLLLERGNVGRAAE